MHRVGRPRPSLRASADRQRDTFALLGRTIQMKRKSVRSRHLSQCFHCVRRRRGHRRDRPSLPGSLVASIATAETAKYGHRPIAGSPARPRHSWSAFLGRMAESAPIQSLDCSPGKMEDRHGDDNEFRPEGGRQRSASFVHERLIGACACQPMCSNASHRDELS